MSDNGASSGARGLTFEQLEALPVRGVATIDLLELVDLVDFGAYRELVTLFRITFSTTGTRYLSVIARASTRVPPVLAERAGLAAVDPLAGPEYVEALRAADLKSNFNFGPRNSSLH